MLNIITPQEAKLRNKIRDLDSFIIDLNDKLSYFKNFELKDMDKDTAVLLVSLLKEKGWDVHLYTDPDDHYYNEIKFNY